MPIATLVNSPHASVQRFAVRCLIEFNKQPNHRDRIFYALCLSNCGLAPLRAMVDGRDGVDKRLAELAQQLLVSLHLTQTLPDIVPVASAAVVASASPPTWLDGDIKGTAFDHDTVHTDGATFDRKAMEMYSDVKLVVNGRMFKCHKAVLALRSRFFAAMFRSGMRESSAPRVQLSTPDEKAFELFISFLYQLRLPTFATPQLAVDFLELCDEYDVVARARVTQQVEEWLVSCFYDDAKNMLVLTVVVFRSGITSKTTRSSPCLNCVNTTH